MNIFIFVPFAHPFLTRIKTAQLELYTAPGHLRAVLPICYNTGGSIEVTLNKKQYTIGSLSFAPDSKRLIFLGRSAAGETAVFMFGW